MGVGCAKGEILGGVQRRRWTGGTGTPGGGAPSIVEGEIRCQQSLVVGAAERKQSQRQTRFLIVQPELFADGDAVRS